MSNAAARKLAAPTTKSSVSSSSLSNESASPFGSKRFVRRSTLSTRSPEVRTYKEKSQSSWTYASTKRSNESFKLSLRWSLIRAWSFSVVAATPLAALDGFVSLLASSPARAPAVEVEAAAAAEEDNASQSRV